MRLVRFLVFLVCVSLVAGLTCFFTSRVLQSHKPASRFSHEAIHEQLGLSAEQEKELKPVEERYQSRRSEFQQRIREANAELAQAILEDQTDSPRVLAAVAKIHIAQGELEAATLAHVFEMKGTLRVDQYRKLLELTAAALRQTVTGQ